MRAFKNSIAQDNVQFPIETVIEPIAGENYSRAVIFMSLELAAENLPGVANPQAGAKYELTSVSYGDVTGGALKKQLVPFFNAAPTAKLAVALFDKDTVDSESSAVTPAKAPLETVYNAHKYYAYFKFALAPAADNTAVQTELAQLCLADPLYSQLWVGTSDAAVLSGSSALLSSLNGAGADARVIYNPDADINPALAQLGDTLATVNATGTPVGNDMDMHAFSTIGASGSDDDQGSPQNLTGLQKTALDNQRVGYQTWVGDGTENVVTEGSMTLKGNSVGAQWVKSYIEYMCKIRTANFITQRNKFRNNAQYQAILCIVSDEVKPFVDFGRLDGFEITAPLFSELPASADAITVPDAWKAQYVDRVRTVTVYGTLYITQPSK